MKRHAIKWQVSLSNGETLFEDKGNFCEVEGEPSPWQKLLLYMAEKRAVITSLSLYSDDGGHWNLPSAGKNPKFRAFFEAPKPIDFDCYRAMGTDFLRGQEDNKFRPQEPDLFTVARAIYANGRKIEIWVDENNPRNCWTLMSD